MPDAGQKDSKFDARPQNLTRLGNSMEKMMEEKDIADYRQTTLSAFQQVEDNLNALADSTTKRNGLVRV